MAKQLGLIVFVVVIVLMALLLPWVGLSNLPWIVDILFEYSFLSGLAIGMVLIPIVRAIVKASREDELKRQAKELEKDRERYQKLVGDRPEKRFRRKYGSKRLARVLAARELPLAGSELPERSAEALEDEGQKGKISPALREFLNERSPAELQKLRKAAEEAYRQSPGQSQNT